LTLILLDNRPPTRRMDALPRTLLCAMINARHPGLPAGQGGDTATPGLMAVSPPVSPLFASGCNGLGPPRHRDTANPRTHAHAHAPARSHMRVVSRCRGVAPLLYLFDLKEKKDSWDRDTGGDTGATRGVAAGKLLKALQKVRF
jgi:hypothetical protein